jgi:hypothetical protein
VSSLSSAWITLVIPIRIPRLLLFFDLSLLSLFFILFIHLNLVHPDYLAGREVVRIKVRINKSNRNKGIILKPEEQEAVKNVT